MNSVRNTCKVPPMRSKDENERQFLIRNNKSAILLPCRLTEVGVLDSSGSRLVKAMAETVDTGVSFATVLNEIA